MTRYVALLRGVNVGTTRLAMADLRRIVTDLGHEDVKTYLQSGNVAFGSTVRDAEKLAAGIERALTDELALTVPVLVRSGRELAAIAGGNPYADREDDPTRLLVAFLATAPTQVHGGRAHRARWRERVVHGDRPGGVPALRRRRLRPVEVHQRVPGEEARRGGHHP